MIYRKIQNNKTMRRRIAVQGNKYFSKLSACGEDTGMVLKNIVRCRSLKYIRKFEFDP